METPTLGRGVSKGVRSEDGNKREGVKKNGRKHSDRRYLGVN